MTTDRETTRIVRSWIQLGVDQLPERVLDAVLEELPTTPQRRSPWSAWRSMQMPNVIKVAAAAVAVLVVVVAGLRLLPASGGIGGPAPTPAPTATPTPAPTPSPTAVPITSVDVSLKAGTYHIGSPFGLPFTITFPEEWTPSTIVANDTQFKKTVPAEAAPWVVVDIPNNVYPDPCHTESGPPAPPVASTVDGLVTALTSMAGFDAGPVSDASVGGHAGKTFILTNTIDTHTTDCTGGEMLPMWTFPSGASGTNGGATEQIWVVDVNGTPVVIDGETFPGTSPADRLTVEPIVNSISFD